jgi:cell division protein FtsZ
MPWKNSPQRVFNLEFEDIKNSLKDKGIAYVGIGTAKGKDKAMESAKMAVSNQFLETTIVGANEVLIIVSGDVHSKDYINAVSYVHEQAGSGANIVSGLVYDASDSDTCNITVIATGLEEQ